MTNRLLIAAACAALLFPLAPAPAQAAAPDAASLALLRPQTPGYVLGHEASDPATGNRSLEYVPAGESVENWTEMLTIQILPGVANVPPLAYFGAVGESWKKACPGGDITVIRDIQENGFPVSVVQLGCDNNPATGKPEYTWMKGVQSGTSMYVVQKAFRFAPEPSQVTQWVRYLSNVTLCSETGSEHPCP